MIHVAIIGTGNIAPAHVSGLLTFPKRCKIVALVDIYPEKAQAMKDKFSLDCEVFDSHEMLLDSDIKVDLVHICTPPYVHSEIAINCMNKGMNIVVEKPMATCLAECDAMLKAEKRNNVQMACIAQNRFRNPIYKLKKMIDSGIAGNIRYADVKSYWWRGHSYYDLWWRGLWEKEGGGPTLNHAVHHIDMLNWFQRELPQEVVAMLSNVMHDNSEVEDLSIAALSYRNGGVAQVTSSVIHHGEEQGIELQCEKAMIAAPWSCCAETSQDNGFPVTGHNQELMKELQEYYDKIEDLTYEGHTGEIEDVLTALENGIKPMITGEDGRNTVELITAIYKAGCKKITVEIPIKKEDEYYLFDGILKNAIRFYKKSSYIENFKPDEITVGNYK